RAGRRVRGRGIGTAPLVRIQLQREIPTRFIQTLQDFVQRRLLESVSQNQFAVVPPWLLRAPLLRDLPARIIGYGLLPPRVAGSQGTARACDATATPPSPAPTRSVR